MVSLFEQCHSHKNNTLTWLKGLAWQLSTSKLLGESFSRWGVSQTDVASWLIGRPGFEDVTDDVIVDDWDWDWIESVDSVTQVVVDRGSGTVNAASGVCEPIVNDGSLTVTHIDKMTLFSDTVVDNATDLALLVDSGTVSTIKGHVTALTLDAPEGGVTDSGVQVELELIPLISMTDTCNHTALRHIEQDVSFCSHDRTSCHTSKFEGRLGISQVLCSPLNGTNLNLANSIVISQVPSVSRENAKFEGLSDFRRGLQIFSQDFCLPKWKINCDIVSSGSVYCIVGPQVASFSGEFVYEASCEYDPCELVGSACCMVSRLIRVDKCAAANLAHSSELIVHGLGKPDAFDRVVFDRRK
jgi:hypothetical protein